MTLTRIILKYFSRILAISIAAIILAACGGGTGSGRDETISDDQVDPTIPSGGLPDVETPDVETPDFPEEKDPKYFMATDLTFTTEHESVSQNIDLSGVAPALSLGTTQITLLKQIDNGWAFHAMFVQIKDSDGVDGSYQCKAADNFIQRPDLDERECFIRFNHDSYAGNVESWVVSPASCVINVERAILGSSGIYDDLILDVDCSDMIIAHTLQDLLPVPAGTDLESTLSIRGKIFATSESGSTSPAAELQKTTASLSISGGDGIVDSDVQMEAVGNVSYVPGVFTGKFKDSSGDHELSLYLNAPYNINDTFDCVDPPSAPGTSPAVYLKEGECLLSVSRKNPDYFNDWAWDSREGGNCKVSVTNARLLSTSYPLYDFQAIIDCPNMASQAITYGYRYPGAVVPAALNIQGSFDFIRVF